MPLPGDPVRSHKTRSDITERGNVEEALRAGEERWRSIFENSAVGDDSFS